MSTSQTFRAKGMVTHRYTYRFGGRAVNIYFVHQAEVILLRAQDGVLFLCSMYSKFAPGDHGTRFFTWPRSEDIVSRVACGVYHFNPCPQTTVKKKQNTKNKQKHC